MSGHRSQPPASLPGNPGQGTEARIAFSNGGRSWTERIDLVELAAAALGERGYQVQSAKGWLEHPESGFVLLPQLAGIQPLENGGVRTATTMQVHHPDLVPDGVFEYQHSAGDDVEQAVRSGFDGWAQGDFVALLEALRPQPATCMTLVMELPQQGARPARSRRAILGPVAHFMSSPPAANEAVSEEAEHPFCPCCLLTNTFQAFKEHLEGDGFFALRLFAARDENGSPQADCRINGEDHEPGAEALREYAATWPAAGYEFRKQYVVLHSLRG